MSAAHAEVPVVDHSGVDLLASSLVDRLQFAPSGPTESQLLVTSAELPLCVVVAAAVHHVVVSLFHC